ncbi:MAG: asparagine synthase-related protein [Ignavibacteriae bacterium]|nr:asparagine synthase-related protein [Ignavibacteriota bacterium]
MEDNFNGIDKGHKRYWKLKYDFKAKNENDIFEIFKNEYLKSIKKRLNDGVNPLLYSGGLDSSTVLFGLKQLVKPEFIEPYFFYFSEYDAQYMFEGPVNKLMKELNLKLNTLEMKFTDDDLFGFISNTMKYTQSTYSSTHAWVKVAQLIKEKYGLGTSVFLGESADGLFGINRTDEGADLYIRDFNTHFNRNKTLLNLNYGDNIWERFPASVGSLLFLFMSPSMLMPRGLGKITEMLCAIFNSRANHKNVSLGLYFGWDGYPAVKRKSFYNDYFSRELNETILNFFEEEYIDSATDFYEDGGIGCVTKSVIYRLEGEGIDMKMKMLPKYYGIRPEFPIFDGKFMEIAYKIPNKYYNYTKTQRPKYPLRVLGKDLGIPNYILDIKKVTGATVSLSPDETLYRSKFGTELKKLLIKRRLFDCLDNGNFNKDLLESIYSDFINKDKNFQEPNRMRVFFALEKLIEDYL